MAIQRRWLRALFLMMMAFSSFGGPMNSKEIEDLLHVMNETKAEFTIPDENDKAGENPPLTAIAHFQKEERDAPMSQTVSTDDS